MSTLTVGTISEKVTDAGVAVDGVTLKDGGANFTSAITATDNTVDLGASSTRFKDVYLSGGAFLGGTGTANKLDDYEEGTWTPTISSGSGTITTVGTVSGIYVKIGRMVTLNWHYQITTNGSGAGFINIDGLPFSSSSQGAGGSARDRSATGVMSVLQMDGAVSRINQYQYNNAYPGADSAKWYCTITYETA